MMRSGGDYTTTMKTSVTALYEVVSANQAFVETLAKLLVLTGESVDEAAIMAALEDALGSVLNVCNARDGALIVRDEDTDDLVFVIVQGQVPRSRLAWQRIPPGSGVAHWVAEHRRPTIVNDARTDDRFYGKIDEETHFETQRIVAAPMIYQDKVLGVIELLNKQDDGLFTTGDQHHLVLICHFAAQLMAKLTDPTP